MLDVSQQVFQSAVNILSKVCAHKLAIIMTGLLQLRPQEERQIEVGTCLADNALVQLGAEI